MAGFLDGMLQDQPTQLMGCRCQDLGPCIGIRFTHDEGTIGRFRIRIENWIHKILKIPITRQRMKRLLLLELSDSNAMDCD